MEVKLLHLQSLGPKLLIICFSLVALLQWCLTSAYPPGTMFVEFFCKKYLPAMDKYIMVIPGRLIVCRGKALDEKLKINKLGPYGATVIYLLLMHSSMHLKQYLCPHGVTQASSMRDIHIGQWKCS